MLTRPGLNTPTMRNLLRQSAAAVAALVGPAAAFVGGVVLVILLTPQAHAPRPLTVSLDPTSLTAKAAILYDPTLHLVLYQKNADQSLPLASITKLMTAEVVLASKSPATPVTITAEDIKPSGDWGFKPGETVALGDLLSFGLIVSSNDAMAAVASSLGSDAITKMNETAAAMGLTKTYFLNPTGLDVSQSVSGAYSSAYDVARLAATFYQDHPDYFVQTTESGATIAVQGQDLAAAATALPLSNLPGFIAGKTGYTDLAGGNLVVVFDVEPGHPLVAAVLGSTADGRFSDIRTLVNAAYQAL